MRIFKYAKIDFIMSKRFVLFMLLFPILAFIIVLKDTDSTPLFASIYCLFIGIILSSSPRMSQHKTESGFSKMLPSKSGEDVKGHFLFAFCLLLFSLLLSWIIIGVAALLRPQLDFGPFHCYVLVLGAAFVFSGIENLIYYLIPTDYAPQTANLLRLLPGMLFFFGGIFFADSLPNIVLWFVTWINPLRSYILFFLSAIIFLIFMEIAVVRNNSRDAL